jgi:hypothetical protein
MLSIDAVTTVLRARQVAAKAAALSIQGASEDGPQVVGVGWEHELENSCFQVSP